jgi:hypothetical protein
MIYSVPWNVRQLMPLTQIEADQLLRMPKAFVDGRPIELTVTQPMDEDRDLISVDRREGFILTVERGRRKRARLKYQTRARKIIVLARLDLDGARHRNPDESPYRPGQWLHGTHLHLYREGFDDRIAYDLADVPSEPFQHTNDLVESLQDFLQFCGVASWPPIQLGI